jgi:hypothetical protein
MQNMMNNLMGDVWMKAFDLKDMDPTKMGLKMLDLQKSAFNNTYNTMVQIQQQAEKMSEPLMKNSPVIPGDWKKMLSKNQDDFKKAIDDGFVKIESYLSSAGK